MKGRLTVLTLGVRDMRRAIAFYDALGLERRMKATGEDVAFYKAGGCIVGLWGWDQLADDAQLPQEPRPAGFRGVTLAWNCNSPSEVDEVYAHAIGVGATHLRKPEKTEYGGYRGYFADPDGHAWEVVTAPGIELQDDGSVQLPD